MRILIACIVLSLSSLACNPKAPDATTESGPLSEAPETTPAEIESPPQPDEDTPPPPEVQTTAADLRINATSFFGISPGDSIATITATIEPDLLQTGDGEFEIYKIKDADGAELGFFYPEDDGGSLVDQITITSAAAQTQEGIHVGMNFQELAKRLDGFEVHGSEIESRVHVIHQDRYFRLTHHDHRYDLDPAEIPADTEVMLISIMRRPND